MKKLILARHGEQDDDGALSPEGMRDIQGLRRALRPHITDSYALYCSDARRARQSANVFSCEDGVRGQLKSFLFSSDDKRPRCEALTTLIAATKEDVLVVVTHYEWIHEFPVFFFRHMQWEVPHALHTLRVQKAEAVVIDVESRSLQKIIPLIEKE